MKKITFFAILMSFVALGISAKGKSKVVLNQTANSITFVVDENLPAPQKDIYISTGSGVERSIVNKSKASNKDALTLASSFRNDTFSYMGSAPFFESLVSAYADHRPLTLSPDMIWLLISQGFCHYVNENPEAFRDKLVSHEGKMLLKVQTPVDVYSSEVRWDEIVNDFDKQITVNTKGDFANTMVADFTTTGAIERTVSQMTMMSTVKSYFDFLVIYISCGIPNITLEGTTVDWESVLNRTKALNKYGMGWWTKDLIPILKEFVNASKGKVNQSFWKSIVKKQSVDKLKGGGCSLEKPTEVDGWFLKLMPFTTKGRTPKSVKYNFNDFVPQIVTTDFTYQVLDLLGTPIKTVSMEMWAGFVGADIDATTGGVRPKLGWLVRESGNEDDVLNSIKSNSAHNPLVVDEFPEILKKIDYLPRLQLNFNDKIDTPDWIGDLKIDQLDLKCKHDEKDLERLRQLFHDRKVRDSKDLIIIEAKESLAPEDYVFTDAPNMEYAWFPGGSQELSKFIQENRRIPEPEVEKGKLRNFDNVVIVTFIIRKDGSITDIKASSRSNNKEHEAEALRIFSSMPKWKPAIRYGKPVNMKDKETIFF